MSTKFFTNDDHNTLLTKLDGIFQHGPPIAHFDALVAYFYATGYFKVRSNLETPEEFPQIRILVGMNVDKQVREAQRQGLLFAENNQASKADYIARLKEEINTAEYRREIEDSARQFIEDIATKKVLIRIHPSRRLHAKIYIFRPREFNEHSGGEVITGSSNLTEAGLGGETHRNYEFNVSLRDYADVKFATDEFERLWSEGVDIPPEDLEAAKNKTFLRDDVTPFELYMKLLITYFGSEIEFDPSSLADLPKEFKRLNYQIDAVFQGRDILNRHNGFFLADVVGLGKTVVATMIARECFHRSDRSKYGFNTLIVSPPALTSIWRETVEKFGLQHMQSIEYITNGSLHKITDPKYSLIIVDESHRFRNNTSGAYAELQRICKTPNLKNDLPKVILVSATPLNNRPEDIKNQVLLFQDENYSTLDINLGHFFAKVIKSHREISSDSPHHAPAKVAHLYKEVRDRVIEPLTVRRTRSDLQNHEQYSKDLVEQGIHFPEPTKPQLLFYELETNLNRLYDSTMQKVSNPQEGLRYTRYHIINYMKPEHRKDYARPEHLTTQLTAIMKSLLVKRLDSSFYAFHKSLQRFVESSRAVIKMVENNRIIVAPDHEINQYILNDDEDALLEKLLPEQATNRSIKVLRSDDFEPDFKKGLYRDHKILTELEREWGGVVSRGQDPKVDKLLSELGNLLDARQNPQRKLVIFSEAADTTRYLERRLQEAGYRDVLAVDSKNRNKSLPHIKHNFDANIDIGQQRSEYNIIIATEVLAEGINLHRANTIVNYDTPWNATRLMQRMGRINRIGAVSDKIYVYNFLPTDKVEGDIGLRQRAMIKLQAFHSALGEDSQIYTPDERVESFGLFDDTPKELDDTSERLKYLMELRKLKEEHPDQFKRIANMPLKMRNAVVDPELAGQTTAYLQKSLLKRESHTFYSLGPDDQCQEISFLEAARVLKRTSQQHAVPRPDFHYPQVQQAVTDFKKEKQHQLAKERLTPNLTNRQTSAINTLKGLFDLPATSETDREQLLRGIECVRRGSIQALPREINNLAGQSAPKNSQTTAPPPELLQQALGVIARRVPQQTPSDTRDPDDAALTTEDTQAPEASAVPRIIIAQSYLKA